MKTATKSKAKLVTPEVFADTGRLKASSKRTPPAKDEPQSITVYVVLMEEDRVIRVTHDPADAERYRKVFANPPGKRRKGVRIIERAVQL